MADGAPVAVPPLPPMYPGAELLLRDGQMVRVLQVDNSRPRSLLVKFRGKENITRWQSNASVAVHPRLETFRKRLKPPRHLHTAQWLALLDPSKSVLVQVGANDHAADHGGLDHLADDPGPMCVRRGWRHAHLIEPMATTFEALQRRYGTRAPTVTAPSTAARSQISLHRAAVCGSACDIAHAPFWSVDLANGTGTFGSLHADGRCAAAAGEATWLSEIASLDRRHLLKHAPLFRHTPHACDKCTAALRRTPPLPPSCMQRLVVDNLVSHEVDCLCLPALLRAEAHVSLLLIDAEGRDAAVLDQYPFEALPPDRVAFEAMHLSSAEWDRSVARLRALGYENVLGARQTAWQSVWHRVDSTEALAEPAAPPAATA